MAAKLVEQAAAVVDARNRLVFSNSVACDAATVIAAIETARSVGRADETWLPGTLLHTRLMYAMHSLYTKSRAKTSIEDLREMRALAHHLGLEESAWMPGVRVPEPPTVGPHVQLEELINGTLSGNQAI